MSANLTKIPKAYRLGHQDFYGRDFIVTRDVLIPRPETETIIDEIKLLSGLPILPGIKPTAPKIPQNPIILDIGTGSGCLAVTLQLELPKAQIFAADISKSALAVAQKNADRFSVSPTFLLSDLLANLPEQIFYKDFIIVANLPYVDRNWPWIDQIALSYEPEIALYAKRHGLALYYQLFDQLHQKIRTLSNQNIFVILEADPSQHVAIIEYAENLKDLRHIKTTGFILTFGR